MDLRWVTSANSWEGCSDGVDQRFIMGSRIMVSARMVHGLYSPVLVAHHLSADGVTACTSSDELSDAPDVLAFFRGFRVEYSVSVAYSLLRRRAQRAMNISNTYTSVDDPAHPSSGWPLALLMV